MRALYPWILGAAVAASGCSLSLQFDCQEDGDCANLQGTYMCNAGACVEIEADMSPDMTPEPEGFSCADGQPLIAANCFDLLGPLAGSPGASADQRQAEFLRAYQEYELIAVHVPAGGFQASGKDVIQAAVHFAINHINESGGLTYGAEGETRKLLAAMICNDANADGSPAAGIESAQHAVDCGAKAIVGTYSSTLTVEMFREVAQDAEIPVISPGAISPQIPEARQTLGDDEGLLWRIKVPGEALVRAVVGLIDYLGYQNVHIFYRPATQYDNAMREELELVLGGGRSTAHRLEGTAGASADQITALLLEQDPPPDLVVSVVEDLGDLLDVAVGMIDATTEAGLQYDLISVEGARSAQAAGIIASQRTGNPNPVLPVICRAMGISSGSKNGNSYTQWLNKFRAIAVTYGINDLDSRLVAPVPAYVDAVFVTAYAMASALRVGNGELTTVRIVDGLKLLSDPAIDGDGRVQPHQWTKGLDGLGPNGSNQINYDGASGSIDLDPVTQDVSGRKTELWQYLLGDSAGLNDAGDLVPDTAESFDPDPEVVADLLSTDQRPVCEPYPFVGTPPMP